MPNLFSVGGYKVYFWSNEGMEPIHVHETKKTSPNSTKIWLTRKGGCVIANNNSHISTGELNELLKMISA